MPELKEPLTRPARSRFVTVLGWFFCIVGALAVPVRLAMSLELRRTASLPASTQQAIREAITEAFGGTDMHTLTRFSLDHLELMAVLNLLASVLVFAFGVGLVRRRLWAFPVGAVLACLGVLRQGSALIVSTSSQPFRSAGMSASMAREFAPMLSAFYVFSLAWLAFLIWKLRRPKIVEEFSK